MRDSNGIHLAQADARRVERFADDRDDSAQMLAGCQFRNHASVPAVRFHLRSHDRRQNAGSVFNHRRGCLVTRAFYAQNSHPRCYSKRYVLVSDFSYDLPDELIAQKPPEQRGGSRMLVVDRASGIWEDRTFRDLPGYLRTGDALVLNDSRVIPSRLYAVRPGTTGRIEVLLLRPHSEDGRTWQALVRPGRKVPVGQVLQIGDELVAEVVDRDQHGQRTIRFRDGVDIFEALDRVGHMPLPPYIRRSDEDNDKTRYNTVYAAERGSVAAPTAGLHFTEEILRMCESAGAQICRVTLHVGLGTFAPLHVERVDDVRLHSERYSLPLSTYRAIAAAQRRIAVGTTSVRTLETVAATEELYGETSIFISPGHRFRLVDALLTNFHLPRSSLLMLVSAFAGRELTLAAYEYAVREQYRFFSYGDCMLIL